MLDWRRSISPHVGPRSHTRRDAHGGVFHHQAARRVDLQMGGSSQVHIRVRLAARHLMPAENAACKKVNQAHLLEGEGVRVQALHLSDQIHGMLMQGRVVAASETTPLAGADWVGTMLRAQ